MLFCLQGSDDDRRGTQLVCVQEGMLTARLENRHKGDESKGCGFVAKYHPSHKPITNLTLHNIHSAHYCLGYASRKRISQLFVPKKQEVQKKRLFLAAKKTR
jgi:hypothetical protein